MSTDPPRSRRTAGFFLALALLVPCSCASRQGQPVAFTTDGCTASPDGTLSDPDCWEQACTIHDYRYWRGGTPAQRRDADRDLAANIAKAGNPGMGQIYRLGTRLGGSPWLPTPWRWGYAWGWPRGYGYLSEAEKAALDELQPGPPAL